MACAWAIGSVAGAATFHGKLVVEDFECFTWGEEWATVQFSPGADPRMKAERSAVRSGSQACRLDVPPGETLTLVAQHGTGFVGNGDKPPLPLPGVPERIGLWVGGEQSGHRLWLRLADATGKTADVALGAVDFLGWKYLDGPVPPLAPPVALRGLVVRGGDGVLLVDDLTVETSADEPLHLAVRPDVSQGDVVEGEAARVRVVLQSLAEEPAAGRGELVASSITSPGAVAARTTFRYRVSAAQPFQAVLRLRLAAGVYSVAARVGKAECGQRVVVYPAEERGAGGSRSAIRRFGARGDALRITESALSPAIVVETTSDRLSLFRGLAETGLRVPEAILARVRPKRTELSEPWFLAWFGAAAEMNGVTLADGSPCPTFDVPFLLVFDKAPVSWKGGDGLEFTFRHRGARVAVMPLYGVKRVDPASTTRWHGTPEIIAQISRVCEKWVPLLRAIPVDVDEEYRIDVEHDLVEVRASFRYVESAARWGGRARRAAPVPPLLVLAQQAGLPIRFSKEPVATGAYTSVGPYCVVPDAEGYTYTISGLLRFIHSTVADVPAGVPGAQVSLARDYRTLSDDAPKIPFWVAHGGAAGKLAADALARYMLSDSNAAFGFDATGLRLRAWDGLVAKQFGDTVAAASAADFLQGCWYAGLHAGAWDAHRHRWRHILAVRNAVGGEGDWATLGLGSREEAADVSLNAGLYFARLAARIGVPDQYAAACAQAVKRMAAAYALVAAAPRYTHEMGPWAFAADGQDKVFGRCRSGSVGLAAGPPPFVTGPSDGGYSFAAEFLGEYYRERFRGGPLDYFGRTPAEWSQRLFVKVEGPEVGPRFRPGTRATGPFATNYVFSLRDSSDGWPAIAWESHRAPGGGPLHFGGIGTSLDARGRLERRVTVSPWCRLSAWSAIEAPRPPKEAKPQPPPGPKEPPVGPGPGIPDRSQP